jgi:hypothetical protein
MRGWLPRVVAGVGMRFEDARGLYYRIDMEGILWCWESDGGLIEYMTCFTTHPLSHHIGTSLVSVSSLLILLSLGRHLLQGIWESVGLTADFYSYQL